MRKINNLCHYVYACILVCVRVCDKTRCLHAAVSVKKGRKMPILPGTIDHTEKGIRKRKIWTDWKGMMLKRTGSPVE